jgi:hypothetical protein
LRCCVSFSGSQNRSRDTNRTLGLAVAELNRAYERPFMSYRTYRTQRSYLSASCKDSMINGSYESRRLLFVAKT